MNPERDGDRIGILAAAQAIVDEEADCIAFDDFAVAYDQLLDLVERIHDRHPERAQLVRRAMFHLDLAREGLA